MGKGEPLSSNWKNHQSQLGVVGVGRQKLNSPKLCIHINILLSYKSYLRGRDIFCPFYKWRNWGRESSRELPKEIASRRCYHRYNVNSGTLLSWYFSWATHSTGATDVCSLLVLGAWLPVFSTAIYSPRRWVLLPAFQRQDSLERNVRGGKESVIFPKSSCQKDIHPHSSTWILFFLCRTYMLQTSPSERKR